MSVPEKSQLIRKNRGRLSGRQAAREILIICIATRTTSQERERLSELLAGKVDWVYLKALIGFHDIATLIYHNIQANDLSRQIDKSFLEALKNNYNETLYRNIILSDELTKVMSAFNKHNIPVIALKGLALAEMLYENLVLRTMSDIDILVPPDDLSQADTLLKEMGYEQSPSSEHIGHPFHGVPYIKAESFYYCIELHWDLEDKKLISIPRQQLWERAQTLHLQWGDARVLSYEDALIFSIIQLHKEFDRLKVLSDITELVKKYEGNLDWDYIVDSARSWRISIMSYHSLRVARDLLEAPVPLSVFEALKPGVWHRRLVAFLTGRKIFLAPTTSYKLRAETLNIIRSLMMDEFKQTLYVLKKYRDKGLGVRWLRTTFWMIIVYVYALWRNITGMISGRI